MTRGRSRPLLSLAAWLAAPYAALILLGWGLVTVDAWRQERPVGWALAALEGDGLAAGIAARRDAAAEVRLVEIAGAPGAWLEEASGSGEAAPWDAATDAAERLYPPHPEVEPGEPVALDPASVRAGRERAAAIVAQLERPLDELLSATDGPLQVGPRACPMLPEWWGTRTCPAPGCTDPVWEAVASLRLPLEVRAATALAQDRPAAAWEDLTRLFALDRRVPTRGVTEWRDRASALRSRLKALEALRARARPPAATRARLLRELAAEERPGPLADALRGDLHATVERLFPLLTGDPLVRRELAAHDDLEWIRARDWELPLRNWFHRRDRARVVGWYARAIQIAAAEESPVRRAELEALAREEEALRARPGRNVTAVFASTGLQASRWIEEEQELRAALRALRRWLELR